MSMILVLQRVTDGSQDETSQPVVDAADQVEQGVLKIFNGDAPVEESAQAVKNILSGVLGAVGGFGGFGDESDEGPGTSLCLEKAWHGLHYLLSGDCWGGNGPRAFLLNGGVAQGDDKGYGPDRYFAAPEVRAIAQDLANLSVDDLWQRFDAQTMTAEGVYPGIWDEPEEDLQEEYGEYFEELQQFLSEAAEQDEAIIISMT